MIIEQDLHAVKIRDMLRQQVDSFSSSAANIELENIVHEIEQLEIEHNSQTHTEQNEPNDIENMTKSMYVAIR